jgi:hypothetical protein
VGAYMLAVELSALSCPVNAIIGIFADYYCCWTLAVV